MSLDQINIQFLSVAFHKVQNVKGDGTKIIYTLSCSGLKFVCCPKITIISCVTLVKKNQPLSLLHLQGPIFDSISRLNSITEICLFSVCLQAGAPEKTRQHSILNRAHCMVKNV